MEELNQMTEIEATDNTLVDEIQQWKANSVSKEKYTKLEEQYKYAMDALMNGGQIEEAGPDTVMDYKSALNDLVQGSGRTNLDYVKLALEAREAGLKQGENINMPFGPKAEYTDQDEEKAEYIASKLQECVDKANGNPKAFNFYFDQIMVDNRPPAGRKTFR